MTYRMTDLQCRARNAQRQVSRHKMGVHACEAWDSNAAGMLQKLACKSRASPDASLHCRFSETSTAVAHAGDLAPDDEMHAGKVMLS